MSILKNVFISFMSISFMGIMPVAYAEQHSSMKGVEQVRQLEQEQKHKLNATKERDSKNAILINPQDYKKPPKSEIKEKLSTEEYEITQQSGTERAYSGKYWDTKTKGLYVDIVTGEPLFISTDKYDSGTGWPSFTKPIQNNIITEHKDNKYGMARTEVRSLVGNSHLGHIFNDGPKDQGGLRYCINSASLRFIAYDDMDKEGYGELKKLVQ